MIKKLTTERLTFEENETYDISGHEDYTHLNDKCGVISGESFMLFITIGKNGLEYTAIDRDELNNSLYAEDETGDLLLDAEPKEVAIALGLIPEIRELSKVAIAIRKYYELSPIKTQ